MNILIVGGTGPLGSAIAFHLQDEGHSVTISSRNRPKPNSIVAQLEWVRGNYLEETYDLRSLSDYDAIVFAAGSDMRHVPPGEDPDEHYLHANGVMVPKFATLAKKAGVKTFIHIGSFYPHVLPSLINDVPYVKSRHLASTAVCELSSDTFRALSLDAPFVVGVPTGMKDPMWMAYLSYGRGLYADVPPFGPAGGTNFISVRTLADAVSGALAHGEGGKAYLLGDENLSFAEFFEKFFRAVGNTAEVPSLDQEHPMLPDLVIMQGRGNFISYEPDPVDVETLGYRRNDVGPMIKSMADDVQSMIGDITPVELGPDATFDADLFAIAVKYGWALDNGNEEVLRSICADEILLIGPGFVHQGVDEVVGLIGLLSSFFHSTRHEVSQQLVEIDVNVARGETLCRAHHVLRSAEEAAPQKVLTWAVRYQDEFERQEDQWRLKRRAVILEWIEISDIHNIIQ